MAKLLQTRSLHRGLDILDGLANGPASLQKLHEQTGLSKSTLRRLLATLVDRRYIRRGISDNIYRSNVAVPTSAFGETAVRYGRLVEVASPYMMQLTEAVKWPSDLHVYHDGHMQILESTHGLYQIPEILTLFFLICPRFPNHLVFDSTWRTREVRHGFGASG